VPGEEPLQCARELDRHNIPSRYPNDHPAGTQHEAYDEPTAGRAFEAGRRVVGFVVRLIEGGRG